MAPESWLVLTVAAAFLLLGIAASPLAWVALMHRRSRAEQESDRRFHELSGQLRTLQDRLERCESSYRTPRAVGGALERATAAPRQRPIPATSTQGWSSATRVEARPSGTTGEPKLIAVPNLVSAATDREAALNGLSQRYAAIWTLADTGASPEVIARATGQPIGRIELILGLRRQIDGSRTTMRHATHE